MSALLPCPFCGGGADLMELFEGFCGECGNCETTGPAAETEAAAIAAWNQRATPAEVAGLRAERDKYQRRSEVAERAFWRLLHNHTTLRAEVERLRGALSPLVAVIPDICNALDLDPDETSIRVRVDGGARDGEVLAERTLADMLTVARAALTHKEPGDEG